MEMDRFDVIRKGSIYQNEQSVTVLEHGRRRITFHKNAQAYELVLYGNGDETSIFVKNGNDGAVVNKSDGANTEPSNVKDVNVAKAEGTAPDTRTGSGESTSLVKTPVRSAAADKSGVKSYGEYVCACVGILGVVKFTEGYYLIVVTDAEPCGRLLLKHDVYAMRSKQLVPLHHPCSNNYTEKSYRNFFDKFEINNNFYFSYSYNMTNSLQTNRMYSKCDHEDDEWLAFDSVMTTQKFRYNFSHVSKLGEHFGAEAKQLCLRVIHGYFGQATICFTGRNIILHLIARRSRFYAGTRYKKRGISSKGYVANDVETEQILEEVTCTNSVFSFVQVRGSTPTFWTQEVNQTIIKKPPLKYPQNDPTFTPTRLHIANLLSLYGAPLIMLNLLSDDPSTDEGQLSLRYEEAIKSLNAEMPPAVHMQYDHRNIRTAFGHGRIRQIITEIVDHAERELGFFHERGNQTVSIQVGMIRESCLDCLDRTNVVAMHIGMSVFQKQLGMLGIRIPNGDPYYEDESTATTLSMTQTNEEYGFRNALNPVLDLFKVMFGQLGDDLALQYAGSKTLRKYEGSGGAVSMSLQLFTTIKRRYHSNFADSERQALSNVFLGVLKAGKHPPPWSMDVDAYIHHDRFKCNYDNLDWWVVPLTCFLKRARKLTCDVKRPWFELFDENGEYRPWALMAQLFASLRVKPSNNKSEEKDPVEGAIAVKTKGSIDRLAEYTAFERHHIGKILQIKREDEDVGSILPAYPAKLERALPSLPPPPLEVTQPIKRACLHLGIRNTDTLSISLFLQPWRIVKSGDANMDLNVSQLKCREKDLSSYRRFIEVDKLH
ncbi:polyphosphoinositide phosphatase [Babesia gibsoni]|uniref:Polyphosphoinositide phosphatase n=1 Tax=Babesia gibsoni TaxID=33632 RepID=A0AAD8LPW7_BABGI|nr:polyphosphoinositide phosphatase [Babesia gibsoni]